MLHKLVRGKYVCYGPDDLMEDVLFYFKPYIGKPPLKYCNGNVIDFHINELGMDCTMTRGGGKFVFEFSVPPGHGEEVRQVESILFKRDFRRDVSDRK